MPSYSPTPLLYSPTPILRTNAKELNVREHLAPLPPLVVMSVLVDYYTVRPFHRKTHWRKRLPCLHERSSELVVRPK